MLGRRLLEFPDFINKDRKFTPASECDPREEGEHHFIDYQVDSPSQNGAPEHRATGFPSTVNPSYP